jgi:hypothetical protein
MLLYKSKIIVVLTSLLTILSLEASELRFSQKTCLDLNFQTDVTHKGHPFGLTETKLVIEKQGCVLKIQHESLKFVKKSWEIDVCRAPVHIKAGTGAVTVLRREGPCTNEAQSRFCTEAKSIQGVLQNDGLIFAQGEREDMSTPHGQIHCSYTLLQSYLYDGRVLSRHGMEEEQEISNKSRLVRRTKVKEKEDEQEEKSTEEKFPESDEPGKF